MEQQPAWQPARIFRRSPFEIIGESFAVYGRHFRRFFLIALIIQIPLSVFDLAMSDTLALEDLQAIAEFVIPEESLQPTEGEVIEPPAVSINGGEIVRLGAIVMGYLIVNMVLISFSGGAIIYAVGMQYATGRIDIGACYGRAWWRVVTLVALGLVLFALSALTLMGFVMFIIPGIAVMVLATYLSVDVPSAIIEGCKPISALKRSVDLVRRNWWRTFVAWLLMILVILGLSVIIGLPLSAVVGLAAPEGVVGTALETAVNLFVSTIIAPLPAIAAALIYLDLRSRSVEGYDMNGLAENLGLPPRNDDDADDGYHGYRDYRPDLPD